MYIYIVPALSVSARVFLSLHPSWCYKSAVPISHCRERNENAREDTWPARDLKCNANRARHDARGGGGGGDRNRTGRELVFNAQSTTSVISGRNTIDLITSLFFFTGPDISHLFGEVSEKMK